MKSVSLTELKRDLSALVDLVKKAHEALLVTDRGVPVVVVTAATGQASQMVEGCVMRLERAGHLVRAKKAPASIDIDSLAVHPRKMVDAVAAIIAEREEGR